MVLTQALYQQHKYMSNSAKKEVIDLPRLVKILYLLLIPAGRFHPSKYNPPVAKQDPTQKLVSLEKGRVNAEEEELVIEPVEPRLVAVKNALLGLLRFSAQTQLLSVSTCACRILMLREPASEVQKGKQLGQGGQGVAYFATYNGIKLCAKFLLGQITPQVVTCV